MITTRGIYLDLKESVYHFKYDRLDFYFSSEFYLNKFKEEYEEYIKSETLKLSLKYGGIFYADELLLISLYKKIEKRGFRVICNNKELNENYHIDILISNL